MYMCVCFLELGDFNFTFGDRFIEYIDDDDVIDLVMFMHVYICTLMGAHTYTLIITWLLLYIQEFTSDPDEGIKKVEDGIAYGFFKIPANFSTNYLMR